MINTNLRGLSLALAAVMETQDTVFLFAYSLLTLERGEKHSLLVIVTHQFPKKCSPGHYSPIAEISTKAQCKIHFMCLSATICASIVTANSQKIFSLALQGGGDQLLVISQRVLIPD